MKKIIGFLICLIIGGGILYLALINESLYCSHDVSTCLFSSKFVNRITIREEVFPTSDIDKIYCDAEYQPGRSGKTKFYVLKLLKKNGEVYKLGSYQREKLCKKDFEPIDEFNKNTSNEFSHESGMGFVNLLGITFGIIILYIGNLILRTRSQEEIDLWADEEAEEDNDNDNKKKKKDKD